MKIYGIFDKVADCFAPPFVAKNDGVASRMFLQSCRKMSNVDDLSLHCLGDWNDEDKMFPFVSKASVEIPVQFGDVEDEK